MFGQNVRGEGRDSIYERAVILSIHSPFSSALSFLHTLSHKSSFSLHPPPTILHLLYLFTLSIFPSFSSFPPSQSLSLFLLNTFTFSSCLLLSLSLLQAHHQMPTFFYPTTLSPNCLVSLSLPVSHAFPQLTLYLFLSLLPLTLSPKHPHFTLRPAGADFHVSSPTTPLTTCSFCLSLSLSRLSYRFFSLSLSPLSNRFFFSLSSSFNLPLLFSLLLL